LADRIITAEKSGVEQKDESERGEKYQTSPSDKEESCDEWTAQ
jgi:hypothetical protein